MSEQMGPLTFGKKAEQIFLGREIAQHQDYSEDTAMQIDKEVKKVVLAAYAEATELLEENRDALTLVAEALLEYETLDANEVKVVLKGEKIHREPEVEPPDAPEPEQKEKEQEKSLPSLVNPDERPAPA
jgi:cell division protease FtsH